MVYVEETKTIEVAPGTGVPGLLRTVAAVLALPRIQVVEIKAGAVVYTRFKRPEDPDQVLELDLSTLMPAQVVRSNPINEVALAGTNAATAIGQMFAQVSMDGYLPVAFVGNPNSRFWAWYTSTTSVMTSREELYGQPFYADKDIPEETLLLCAALGRKATMVDVVRSYKITVPLRKK